MKNIVYGFLGAGLVCVVGVTQAAAIEPYLPRGEKIFKRVDANSDGKIEESELKPLVMRRFNRFDTNGDKAISGDELQKVMQAAIEKRRNRIMKFLDANNDGSISESELDKILDSMFNAADSDHDGALTMAESRDFKRGPWRRSLAGTSAN